MIRRILAAFTLVASAFGAQAATYYVSDCGVGAAPGCVVGDNTRSAAQAQNPATPWQNLSAAALTGGPHTICFVRGGAWDAFSKVIGTAQGATAANPYIYSGCAGAVFPNEDAGVSTTSAGTTLNDPTKSWGANAWVGYTIYVKAPHWANNNPNNSWLKGVITANTSTSVTVSAWMHYAGLELGSTPQAGSAYRIQGPKPRLNAIANAGSSQPVFANWDSGNPDYEAGFVFRDMEWVGHSATGGVPFTSYTGHGYRLLNVTDSVLLDDLIIRHFSFGVLWQKDSGTHLPSHPDGMSRKLTLRDSLLYDNRSMGFLISGKQMVVERNWLDLNGWGSASRRDHNMYLSESETAIVRENTSTRNARYTGTGADATVSPLAAAGGPSAYACAGASLLGHDTNRSVVLEYNFVFEDNANGYCWGLAIDGTTTTSLSNQDMRNFVARGNRIVMTGAVTLGITCSSCPRALIESNTVVMFGSNSAAVVQVPSGSTSALNWNGYGTAGPDIRADTPDTAWVIRNNSLYIDNASSGAKAFELRDNSLWQRQFGTYPPSAVYYPNASNVVFANNLVVWGPSTPATARCVTYARPAANLAFSGKNVCYRAAGVATWYEGGTLAAAQAAGLDTGSSTADPMLLAVPSAANYWRVQVQAGSPLINAANAANASRTAANRLVPIGARDIGAEDFGAIATRPRQPTQGRAWWTP